jgi:hypothetical protein
VIISSRRSVLHDSLLAHYESRGRKYSHKGREIRKILSQICQGLYVKYTHAVGSRRMQQSSSQIYVAYRYSATKEGRGRTQGIISPWMSGRDVRMTVERDWNKEWGSDVYRQNASPQHDPTKSMHLFWCSFTPAHVTRTPHLHPRYVISSHHMSNRPHPQTTVFDQPPPVHLPKPTN